MNKEKSNRAFIFDMDGVVVQNDRYHYEAWKQFAGQHGKSVGFDEVKSWFGSTNEAILSRFFGRELSKEEVMKFASQKEALYREIYSPHIHPLDGLKEFLEEAKENGFQIGLATAAPPENVDFVLKATGFVDHFDEITDDTRITRGKPDPEIFLVTAEKMNIEPGNCIVFEDSLYGIEAARKAGMKVVAVSTTHSKAIFQDVERVISDFSEINIREAEKILNK